MLLAFVALIFSLAVLLSGLNSFRRLAACQQ
jgi:hypothetical protein